MAFLSVWEKWVEALESIHGVPAKPVGATEAEIGEFEEHWGCELTPQYRQLVEYSNGLFLDQSNAHTFPRMPLYTMKRGISLASPQSQAGLRWIRNENVPYIDSGPFDTGNFVQIGVGGGAVVKLNIVCGGPADGAVFATDEGAPYFEWVARSLEDFVSNCLWYHEQGFFDTTIPFKFQERLPGRPHHPNALFGWTLMPYERDYTSDLPVGAWRWEPEYPDAIIAT